MPYRKPLSLLVKPPAGTPLDRSHPVNFGLRAFWAMNEGAGGLIRDAIAGHYGSLVSVNQSAASGWNPGKFGKTLLFDGGTTAYVNVPDAPNLSFAGAPFSISFWIKRTSVALSQEVIIGKYSSPFEYVIGYSPATILWWLIYDDTQGTYLSRQLDNSEAYFSDLQWHHVVCTYDGGTSVAGMHVYSDMKLTDGTGATPGGFVSVRNTTAPLTIGHAVFASNSLNGSVDLIRIYGRELNLADVGRINRADRLLQGWVNPRRRIINGVTAAPAFVAKKSLIVRQAVNRASTY